MKITRAHTEEINKSRWEKIEVTIEDHDLVALLEQHKIKEAVFIVERMPPGPKFVLMEAEIDRHIAFWKKHIVKTISEEEYEAEISDADIRRDSILNANSNVEA